MTDTADASTESPRSRGTAVERVLDHLREGILNGRFAPGQRLIEAELTHDLNISRSTLREAFSRLSAEGLIEIVPNRGALVRRLSFRETLELFEIRTELESLATRLAAERIDDDGVRAHFEAATAPIWDDAPRLSAAAYLEENARFHNAVVDASGNRQLGSVSRQLQLPLIMSQIGPALTADILANSVTEHRQIAEAILSGRAADAETIMRSHLTRAAELTREMPATTFRR